MLHALRRCVLMGVHALLCEAFVLGVGFLACASQYPQQSCATYIKSNCTKEKSDKWATSGKCRVKRDLSSQVAVCFEEALGKDSCQQMGLAFPHSITLLSNH
eukprot:3322353-Amphidinium_carterae.1